MFYTKWKRDKDDCKDLNLDTTLHELYDQCQYPTIEEQIQLFIDAGEKLQFIRSIEEPEIDDSEYDDIDELSTPLDSPDLDIQDIDKATKNFLKKSSSQNGSSEQPKEVVTGTINNEEVIKESNEVKNP